MLNKYFVSNIRRSNLLSLSSHRCFLDKLNLDAQQAQDHDFVKPTEEELNLRISKFDNSYVLEEGSEYDYDQMGRHLVFDMLPMTLKQKPRMWNTVFFYTAAFQTYLAYQWHPYSQHNLYLSAAALFVLTMNVTGKFLIF